MNRKITVVCDGVVSVHMSDFSGDYSTACGMDGDDLIVGQVTIQTKRGARIDCFQCRAIWEISRLYKSTDFSAKGDKS